MSDENADRRRPRLIDQLLHLAEERLPEVEVFFTHLQHKEPPVPRAEIPARPPFDWPHAPPHRLSTHGTFMVTAATYQQQHFFRGAERLDYLQVELLQRMKQAGWQLEAWAIFSNRYHFIAHAQLGSADLKKVLADLHRESATHLNELDRALARKVWHNFWETTLTFEKSYLARLNYVQQNAVKHDLVRVARDYPWCSADWFARTATPAQVKVVASFKTDTVNVRDGYQPVW